jgi:hypothetical protein
MRETDLQMHREYENGYSLNMLEEHFKRIRSKLPKDIIPQTNEDYFYNRKGAKVYFDVVNQPLLSIEGRSHQYYVLSVGFHKDGTPMITIQEKGSIVCYRLPEELSEWAVNCVAFSNKGINVFPSNVLITKEGTRYFADVI